mmetsp:Transcript_7999/g.9216  ORF Transcript_7999/g.9216 Transcript_7999/m.9216 type:complete len:746 (+) Transcript_7999:145-2382(+)
MGKKSKNSKSKSKGSGKSNKSNGNSNSKSNKSNNVSYNGCMTERNGRRFYDLLAFLAEIAVPRLESRRKESLGRSYESLGWVSWCKASRSMGMTANPVDIRETVMSFILREIDWIVNEIDSQVDGKYDELFQRMFNRRLSESDKQEIRSWKMHIQDDFIYIQTRQSEGAVLVQCGIQDTDNELCTSDIHEPRVFVVQGLADPLHNILQRPIERFKQEFPAIVKLHSHDHDVTVAVINTTLLPYNGGITYMSHVKSHTCHHYNTPKEMADAVSIAIQASRDAFDTNTTDINTMNNTMNIEEKHEITGSSSSGNGDTAGTGTCTFSLYRSLNPETDASICRLATFQLGVPSELQVRNVKASKAATAAAMKQMNNPKSALTSTSSSSKLPFQTKATVAVPKNTITTTSLYVKQTFWLAYQNQNDPRIDEIYARVCEGPKPFKFEGMKSQVMQELVRDDSDVCPFHNQITSTHTGRPLFKDCCKSDYLCRKRKAIKKRNLGHISIMYEPIEPDQADVISEVAQSRVKNYPNGTGGSENPLNILDYVQIGYTDMGMVRLEIPINLVNLVKARMDNAPFFHAILDYKWIYTGYWPLQLHYMGIMTFGDVELFPETGIFQGDAMTARRLSALIREMKYVCTGVPIMDATIEMQPSHKMKADEEMLKRNQELLEEGLEKHLISAKTMINKKIHEGIRKQCAYCGVSEQDARDETVELSKCPCKLVYFCSVDHQKAHWPNHKMECKRARANMKT